STALLPREGNVIVVMFRVPTAPVFPAATFGPIAKPFILSVPPVNATVVFDVPTVLTSMMFELMLAVPPLTLSVPFASAAPPVAAPILKLLVTFKTPVELGLEPTENVPQIDPVLVPLVPRASVRSTMLNTPVLNEMLPPLVLLVPPVPPAMFPTM